MTTNPFIAKRPTSLPSDVDSPEFHLCGVVLHAEELWDIIAKLPNRPDAIRAQARLQETVFWAEQALAGGRQP